MATTEANLHAVLDAARQLLAAREDGMVTSAEWGALQDAVDDCEPTPRGTDGESP